jgi:hypothetical protein
LISANPVTYPYKLLHGKAILLFIKKYLGFVFRIVSLGDYRKKDSTNLIKDTVKIDPG